MDYVRDGEIQGRSLGKKSWLLSYGKRQFLNCAKFNVAFVMNMLLKRKKFWDFFWVFLQKIKTHYQILGKKLETVTSETLKIKTQ